mgnify:CR=1 FL=1
MNKLLQLWRNNRGFIVFVSLMFVFRSAVADWNDVPTGSMQPTIQIGDRILVNKMAYDVRLPFTTTSLIKRADPKRGLHPQLEFAVRCHPSQGCLYNGIAGTIRARYAAPSAQHEVAQPAAKPARRAIDLEPCALHQRLEIGERGRIKRCFARHRKA